MFALLIATVCGALPPAVPDLHPCTPSAVESRGMAQKPQGQPLKALDAWLKLYRKGKIDYRSKRDIGKKSLAIKYKVRDKGDSGELTYASDLKVILEATAALDNENAARAMADAASVGLNPKRKFTYAMAPYRVRTLALETMKMLTSKEAKEALATGARGEWNKGNSSKELRAAALLALGYIRDEAYEPVIEAALADGSPMVRIHAIDALQMIGDDKATHALIRVVNGETDDAVLVTAAKALRTIYGKFLRNAEDDLNREKLKASDDKKPKEGEAGKDDTQNKDEVTDAPARPAPPTARLAVRAAIRALGRTTWRADMVLVRLLDDFRSGEAVPALIAVLERFRDNPKDVESGKLSYLLKTRVHDLLVSMTGAVYSADQPDQWRELWDKEKDNIKVAEKREPKAKSGTAAAGFVGIPVEGSRVVFIMDLSGSMDWPMNDGGGKMRRIDYAKRELLKAVEGLSPNAMFNLITFNGDDKAESWHKKLVEANKRNKASFKKFVEKLKPLGGTNLWSGMESALNIKTLVYGNNYETTVDEIFLLSDGAPSVGDVQDPVEILRLIAEINRFKEVRINAVFISSETPPQERQRQRQMTLSPAELMRRIAKENGGKFRDV